MAKLYLINDKTGRRYDVISYDKESNELTLKGEHFEFKEKYDKANFQKWGYRMCQE